MVFFILLLIVLAALTYVLLSSILKPKTCVKILSHVPEQPVWIPVPDRIPVWMFWDQTPFPEVIQLCWNNWNYWCRESKHNFIPVLVTNFNITQFIDITAHSCFDPDKTYGPALRSDYIRLALLARYGGVYMDATVIFTEPLDWVLGSNGKGLNFFQAFYNPNNMNISCKIPVIETSFLAAPVQHPLITKWLDLMLELKECNTKEMERFTRNISKQANLDENYHFAYHVMTKILMETPITEFGAYNIYNSIEYNFLNFQTNDMDTLTSPKKARFGPLLKLVSHERKILEQKLSDNMISTGSFVDKYLIQMPSYAIP